MTLVLGEPPLEVEVVELLAPQHAGQRLAVHPALVLAQRWRRDPLVELVGVRDPVFEGPLESSKGSVGLAAASRRRIVSLPPAGTSSA